MYKGVHSVIGDCQCLHLFHTQGYGYVYMSLQPVPDLPPIGSGGNTIEDLTSRLGGLLIPGGPPSPLPAVPLIPVPPTAPLLPSLDTSTVLYHVVLLVLMNELCTYPG